MEGFYKYLLTKNIDYFSNMNAIFEIGKDYILKITPNLIYVVITHIYDGAKTHIGVIRFY